MVALLTSFLLAQAVQPAPAGSSVYHRPTAVQETPAEKPRGFIGVVLDAAQEDGDTVQVVQSVVAPSPAERSGLERGDRLVQLDGWRIPSHEALIEKLTELGPGAKVVLGIERDLAARLQDSGKEGEKRQRLGVGLEGLDSGGDGALRVASVSEGSPADAAGIEAGDRLVSVDGRSFDSVEGLVDHLRGLGGRARIRVRVARDLDLELGRPAEAASTAGRVDPRPSQPRAGRLEDGRYYLGVQPPAIDLRAELEGLRNDLRELREELRQLREQMARMREEKR